MKDSKKKVRKFVKAKPAKQKNISTTSTKESPKSELPKSKDVYVPFSAADIAKDHLKKDTVQEKNQEKTSPENALRNVSFPKLQLPKIQLSKLKFVKRHRGLRKFLQKNEQDLQLVLFPMILLMLLIILNVINTQIRRTIDDEEFHASTVLTKLHPYPFVQEVATPQITANAAIIVDADSQVILFSKNPELRFSMASTTKIMTALTGLDHYKLNDILTIKSYGVEGSGLGLVPGDQYTFKDLLYAMMLPSANDAAQAIADNYPGGAEAFIKQMNAKAASLHLSKTHYADANGLDDDGDYSTVIDMARLASYAIMNPTFAEVTSTKFTTIHNKSYTRQFPLTNLNKLLGTEGVTGIKTGTTEGAGEVLVTSTVKNGHTYIIVVMHSENRFADTSALMKYIDTNVKYVVPSIGVKNY